MIAVVYRDFSVTLGYETWPRAGRVAAGSVPNADRRNSA
jgi:hypothetical protein